jgi:succinate dehydrogenase / fumarate reductase, flavoprotein subunit
MSESLRNDGRVWVPAQKGDKRNPNDIPENERDYYLERRYPAFGNLVPRDVASRAAKERCDAGYGVGDTGLSVYLDFKDAINKQGKRQLKINTVTCLKCMKKLPASILMKNLCVFIRQAIIQWEGLWVDYNLMTTIPGLLCSG